MSNDLEQIRGRFRHNLANICSHAVEKLTCLYVFILFTAAEPHAQDCGISYLTAFKNRPDGGHCPNMQYNEGKCKCASGFDYGIIFLPVDSD